MKRSVLIIHALHDAIKWQDSLIDCFSGCTSTSDVKSRERSEELVAAYRNLYKKLSGRDFDPPPYTGKTVSIFTLAELYGAKETTTPKEKTE